MKEGGSKHREREKSSARGLTAFMLMQHGMISLRSSSTLWGLDHFFIPLKATYTVWEEAPALDLYQTYLSLNGECPF